MSHDLQVRDAITRTVAVIGLVGVALIHLLDAHDTFVATPYKGWLYVGLIVGCLATAAVLVRRNDRRAWLAALLFLLGSLVTYVISRTVGLPNGADDIGNWWEPLGMSSVFVECAVTALAAAALRDQTVAVPRRIAAPRLEGSHRMSRRVLVGAHEHATDEVVQRLLPKKRQMSSFAGRTTGRTATGLRAGGTVLRGKLYDPKATRCCSSIACCSSSSASSVRPSLRRISERPP